jgi:hypothetical protein
VPVPHKFRKHATTGEYVLVCTRCNALWDHAQTDEIIRRVQAGTFAPSESKAPMTPDALFPSPARPPDLQALIARYGGYNRITEEAWAEHDKQVAEWKQARGIGTGLPGKVLKAARPPLRVVTAKAGSRSETAVAVRLDDGFQEPPFIIRHREPGDPINPGPAPPGIAP